jgi:hypothetical protein
MMGIHRKEAGGGKPAPLRAAIRLGYRRELEDSMNKPVITLYSNDPMGKR